MKENFIDEKVVVGTKAYSNFRSFFRRMRTNTLTSKHSNIRNEEINVKLICTRKHKIVSLSVFPSILTHPKLLDAKIKKLDTILHHSWVSVMLS